MLATAMGEDPHFNTASILLLERQRERSNDRTWSYWEKGKGRYDHLLLQQWESIRFKDAQGGLEREIGPYSYKTLRALDFYRYHEAKLEACPNVTRTFATVSEMKEENSGVLVHTSEVIYEASHVFSSIMLQNHMEMQDLYPVLQQHFIGWYIQSEKAIFDPGIATFMDFSVPQKGNTRFMYVLPTSPHSGLVEYTLFSKNLLEEVEYETAIEEYIRNDLKCQSYTISEKEKGKIPMTAYDFSQHNSSRITYIGTAGGWTKPSTGFTFNNIRKNTEKLLTNIKNNTKPIGIKQAIRHRLYDSLLLDILNISNERGAEIFGAMFRKRTAQSILAFLDEETTVMQELRMIWACPKAPFIRALWNRIF